MRTKKDNLKITTPCISSIYLGKKIKQKARFLQLSPKFENQVLFQDIANGANIYDSFLNTLEHPETRYNIITAPTEEDGLRAVQYLAEIHSVKDNYSADDYNSDPVLLGAQCLSYDADLEDTMWDLEDDDEDDFDDEESDFPEAFYRIPIIPISEVESLEYNNTPTGSFGSYSFEMINSKNRPRPWWIDCSMEAVCIVKNATACQPFMMVPELLTRTEINCLGRFSENRRVYLVVVGNAIKNDDFSINTAMMDYTANCFHVDSKKGLLSGYYRKLLLQQATTHGFKLSEKMDVRLLTDRLSCIDKQYPCRKFEKIMDYFVHIKAKSTLNAKDFSAMGLEKLINTECNSDSSNDLDRNLHGMETVKKQVKEIIQTLKYAKLREERGLGSSDFHNVHLFLDAPGTAKTTVAKLMTKMMQEEGIISGDRFVSITGAQLKGAYVGQTAPKVHALFEQYDAIFIDEAYSLTCSSDMENGMDSYSQEALAQLAVELEEHGKDKLVIFAGYGGKNLSKKNNLMYKFLTANPGIRSRINSTIFFDSYTSQEMVSIIHYLAQKAKLNLNSSLDDRIATYFNERRTENDFGNGREARSFLEHCETCLAERISDQLDDNISNNTLNTILSVDIERALQKLEAEHESQTGVYGIKVGIPTILS